jgi:hypothetical protein
MAPNPRIFSSESHGGNLEFLDRKVNIEIRDEKLFFRKQVALVVKGKNSCDFLLEFEEFESATCADEILFPKKDLCKCRQSFFNALTMKSQ